MKVSDQAVQHLSATKFCQRTGVRCIYIHMNAVYRTVRKVVASRKPAKRHSMCM